MTVLPSVAGAGYVAWGWCSWSEPAPRGRWRWRHRQTAFSWPVSLGRTRRCGRRLERASRRGSVVDGAPDAERRSLRHRRGRRRRRWRHATAAPSRPDGKSDPATSASPHKCCLLRPSSATNQILCHSSNKSFIHILNRSKIFKSLPWCRNLKTLCNHHQLRSHSRVFFGILLVDGLNRKPIKDQNSIVVVQICARVTETVRCQITLVRTGKKSNYLPSMNHRWHHRGPIGKWPSVAGVHLHSG